MNNVEKKPNRKNSRYILLFLLILLIALGRWKCPNHPEKEIEAVAIEEDSLELKTAIKSDVVVEQTTLSSSLMPQPLYSRISHLIIPPH